MIIDKDFEYMFLYILSVYLSFSFILFLLFPTVISAITMAAWKCFQ